jgi:hypothetical protein
MRRLAAYAVALAAMLALGAAGSVAPAVADSEGSGRLGPKVVKFVPKASDNARLRAAWKRWVEARGPHYATRVQPACGECPGPPPEIRTEVRRGRLVSVRDVTNDKAVRWRRAWPVDKVYRLLRKGYREAAHVFVRYSERGVPRSVAIDWSEMVADEETYLTVRAHVLDH